MSAKPSNKEILESSLKGSELLYDFLVFLAKELLRKNMDAESTATMKAALASMVVSTGVMTVIEDMKEQEKDTRTYS